MKHSFFLLGLLFLSLVSLAQETVTIQGTITDAKTEETLPRANIYLLSNPSQGAVADTEGNYELTLPKSKEEIILIFSFMGYREMSKSFVPNQNYTFHVALEPISTEIDEVVITAEKLIAEEFTVEKISKLDIYTNPLAKADPVLAVNALPSATTTDESANVSLRGSSPAETGLFLNNVPIYDAVRFAQINGIGTFSIFNTSIINNVQVFPSNPPLEFGNTSAGLIALQTDNVIPEENQHSVSVNLANIGGSSTLRLGNKASLTAFGNYQPSAGLKWLNGDALADLKDFGSLDVGLHFFGKLGEKTQLKVFNYSLSEGYDFLSRHPSAEVLYQQNRKRNFTVASLQQEIKNGMFTLNQGVSFSALSLEGNLIDYTNDQRDLYTSMNLQQRFEKYSHKIGITLDSRNSQFAGDFPQISYAFRPSDPTVALQYTQNFTVLEGYYYGKYLLGEQWTVGAGLRKNVAIEEVPSYWSYQINTHYQATETHGFTFSVGQYHRYNLADANADAPYLVSSQQASLDYQWKTKRAELHAAIFAKDTQLGALQNWVYGGEIFANYNKPNKLDARASFTYIHAQFDDGEQVYASPFDLDFFVKAALEYTPEPTWTIGFSWLYRQGTLFRPVVNAQLDESLRLYQPFLAPLEAQERLPSYSLLNMNISKLLLLKDKYTLVLFASANNVTNRNNVRALEYNFDYSQSTPALFSQRIFFVGGVVSF